MRAYAGVGSRKAPPDVLVRMTEVSGSLARSGWVLRTGGAPGSDQAFEAGARAAGGGVELYLPYDGFEGRTGVPGCPSPEAFRVASRVHPAWEALSPTVRRLHARNVHQVLGPDCRSPSSFIVCWTVDGAVDRTSRETGGTGQAIRVAASVRVRVINMARPDWEDSLADALVEAELLS